MNSVSIHGLFASTKPEPLWLDQPAVNPPLEPRFRVCAQFDNIRYKILWFGKHADHLFPVIPRLVDPGKSHMVLETFSHAGASC